MRKVIRLTETEHQQLKQIVIGHGNLSGNAAKIDMYSRTLERIVITGKGLEENILKVQKLIREANIQ